MAGTCECVNEPSGSIKCGEFRKLSKCCRATRRRISERVFITFTAVTASNLCHLCFFTCSGRPFLGHKITRVIMTTHSHSFRTMDHCVKSLRLTQISYHSSHVKSCGVKANRICRQVKIAFILCEFRTPCNGTPCD